MPGTHTDDGRPMVPTSSEFMDDEWMFWMSLAVSLMLIAPRCLTWDVCVWIGFMLTAIMQILFVYALKKDDPSLLKMYIFISCTLLVTVFGECVVCRVCISVMDMAHPMEWFEVMGWWCSTKNSFTCMAWTYATVRNASLFVVWMRIWVKIPMFSAYAQGCVSV